MQPENMFPFRVVSGFRPIQGLHLGHVAGVLADLIIAQKAVPGAAYVFIADFHVRSKWREPKDLVNLDSSSIELTRQLLAFGLDPELTVIYRQSDIPEVFEVMWFLAGLLADTNLRNMHGFRQTKAPSVGTYLYPLLMAADIICSKATHVAIGQDQKQHLELARDIARKLNRAFKFVFVPIPTSLKEQPIVLRGVDSTESQTKMAFESENELPLFDEEATVLGRIEEISTQPIRYGEPLPLDGCLILEYAAVLDPKAAKEMKTNYSSGRYGYSNAKDDLKQIFLERLKEPRARYNKITEADARNVLRIGASRAKPQVADFVFSLRKQLSTEV